MKNFRVLSRTRVLSPEDHLAATNAIQFSDEDATHRYSIEQGSCGKTKPMQKNSLLTRAIPSRQTITKSTEKPKPKIRMSTKINPSPQTTNNSKEKLQNKGFLYVIVLQICTFFIIC